MFSDLPQFVKDEFQAGRDFLCGWESFYYFQCKLGRKA